MTSEHPAPEQKQPAPAPAPTAQPAAPQPPFVPQQGQPQQVQYVVSERSLEGIGGWLIFWIVVFILGGIGHITAFFSGIEAGSTEAGDIVMMIFSPLLAVGYIGSATTIALRKKIGVWVSAGSLGLTGLYSLINIIVTASQERSTSIAITIGGILVSLVIFGAMALYFFTSKRVKQTLTR